MKKILLMSTTIIIVTLLCVVPFSVHAASNTVWSTGGNFDEGEFNVYTVQASSNGYIQFYFNDQFYSYDQYRSAVITKIDLDGIYTGDINLTFGGISSHTTFPLYWVETSEGSCGIDAVNNYFILHLNQVKQLTFYVCSTLASTNTIQPTAVTTNLTPYNDVMASLADYQIPLESLAGFVFATDDPNTIVYNDGDVYPHLSVDNGDLGRNTAFAVPARGEEIHFVFMSEYNHTTNSPLLEMNTENNVTMTITTVAPFSFSGYRIYDVLLRNNGSVAQTNKIVWRRTANIYPIYFGRLTNMPENYKKLLGFGTVWDNIYNYIVAINGRVNDIYNYLVFGNSSIDDQVNDDIGNSTDDLSDISGNINDITDAIDVDFNDHINNIDLNDHDFFTGLTNTTNYFKVYTQNFFDNIGDIKALLIVPVIVTIMMMIAGWMF